MTAEPGETTLQSGDVPAAARGRWCVFRTGPVETRTAIPLLCFQDADGMPAGDRWYLAPRRGGGCWSIGFVPAGAEGFRVLALGRVASGKGPGLAIRPVGGLVAAAMLVGTRPADVVGLLRTRGLSLATLALMRNRPHTYDLWMRCFEPGGPRGAAGPSLFALVFHGKDGPAAALSATLGSLGPDMPRHVVRDQESWEAAGALRGEYAAILQSGEVLARDAAGLAGAELERLGRPAIAIADMDEISPHGARRNPEFRPEPSHALMLSGTLARGLWLVRRDLLAESGGDHPGWAELLRLAVWLGRHETGGVDSRRIPHVLSHRRPDTGTAPPDRLAALVDRHLHRSGIPLRASPLPGGFPLILRAAPEREPEPVTLIVPSALRDERPAECLRALLDGTAHPALTMLVIVAQKGPLDAGQRAVAARLASSDRVRIVEHAVPAFNFAEANNHAASLAGAGTLCFVNDDVTPLAPDWLALMQAHLADPRVGVVGARLLYPDRTVQHAGVIMGVGGLSEHAFRHLPGDAPGPAWRARLSQEYAAVTGACMLVRRDAFTALGGFDEAYSSAHNDIDLCLRMRAAGFGVVLSAESTLIHHESRTYGSHYAGRAAGEETRDAARMRARWGAVMADDPFYNPNLDLAPGREWQLAFPPRTWVSPPGSTVVSGSTVVPDHDRHGHVPERGGRRAVEDEPQPGS